MINWHMYYIVLIFLNSQKQLEFKNTARKDVESRRIVKMNRNDWVDNPDRCLLEMAGARPTYAMYEKSSQKKFSS